MKQLLTILFVLSAVFAKSQAYIGSDGTIHPTGAFPVINSNEAKGTIKRAKSLADRDALPVSLRDTGMLCWVSDSAKFYVLVNGLENFRWVDLITTGVVGGVAFERDPIFTNSPSYTITEQKKAYWDLVGLMLRADSVRSEIHDSIMVHQRPPINYDPNSFTVTNDTLHAIGKVNGESDPIFNNSVWGQLPDTKPEEWDAKVEQNALNDTAAAIRRSFKADTIYHDARDFYNTGGKNDPLRIKRYTNAQIDSLILANGGKIGDSSGVQFNLAGYYTKVQVDSIIAAFGGTLQDGLIKPGYVTWSGTGYTYDVTGAVYVINGKPYKSSPGSVTLDASDGALNRIDAIVLDTLGAIQRITGVAASNPVAPIPDPSSQVLLTNITVNAGSTGPNSLNTVVWNEKGFGEYLTSAHGTTVNPDNTNFPYSGAKSLDVGAWTNGSTVTFTNASTASATSYTYFKLFIRLKSVVTDFSSIGITFYNGSTPVSKTVSVVSYGINKKLVGVYQNISVPISVFGFTANQFNKIQVRLGGANTDGLYIDYVQLQNSTVTETGSNALTDVFVKDGTDSLFKTVGGNSFFVTRISATGGGTVDTTLRRDININTAAIATKQPLISLTPGRVPFTGINGNLVSSNNLQYDSANSILSVLTNANTKQGISTTNSNSGASSMSSVYVTNDLGTLGGIEQGSSTFGTLSGRNRTTLVSVKGLSIISNSNILSGGKDNIQFYAGGSTIMPQLTINPNRHIIMGDSIDLVDAHNYTAQINGNTRVRDTLFANVLSVGGTISGGGGSSYTLPIASSTTLGGVKVGSGLAIDGSGVLSASASGSTGSAQVYFLSKSGVISDADLSTGSTTFGTDQTTAIQAVLNNGGAANPIVIYWDVKASVTGLKIKGNTKIVALPGMGAILRNSSNKPLMANLNTVFGGTIIDSNIVIEGGTWNGNGYNSGTSAQTKGTTTNGLTNVFSFNGVRNLIVRDFVIYRQTVYAIGANTVENALYENGVIDAGTSATINSDGVHFDGNSKHCTARNIKIKSLDDAVGLNADDLYQSNLFAGGAVNGYYPASASGPISDIKIEDIFLDGGLYGIRLLSGSSRIENIRIKNITGSTDGYGFIADNYNASPSSVTNSGAGNIGTVQIENFNVAIKASGQANAILGCNIDKIIFKDFKRNDFTQAINSILVQHAGTTINNLIIDGYDSNDTTSTNVLDHIRINASTTVNNLRIVRAVINRTNVLNASSLVGNLGTIGSLSLNGVFVDKTGYVVNNTGTISSILGVNIYHTNGTTSFQTSTTIPEITLSNISGGTAFTAGTFTTKKGDAYGLATNTLLTGASGGQTAVGGTATGESLTLKPTAANTNTGKVIFGTLGAYDVANNRIGVGTASPANAIDVTGSAASLGGVAATIKNTSSTGESYLYLFNDQTSTVASGGMELFGSAWTANTALQNSISVSSKKSLFFLSDAGVTSGGANYTAFYGGGSTASQERMRVSAAGVSIGTQAAAAASSVLDVGSTTKGALLPRGTKAQRDAITTPAQGLMFFVTDNGGYLSWYNAGWQKVSSVSDP